ncbi:MAG: toprim domain-containing protein (plasmid) [Candidatus Symbiodolus clandestinus]
MMSQLTAERVHQFADGQWTTILEALTANMLTAALERPGKHVSCPIHGGKDGFRVFKDVQQRGGAVCNTCGVFSDGFSLLMWLNHWGFRQALFEVGQLLGISRHCSPTDDTPRKVLPKPKQPDEPSEEHECYLANQIDQVWGESLPYTAEAALPVRRYLQKRGIWFLHERIAIQDTLRFHANLGYFDAHLKAYFPGLLGAIRDPEGQLVTLQRIYLDEFGNKAEVALPKKMMRFPKNRRLSGCSIPLGRPDKGVLGIAEGIETALAIASVTPYPVWSTVNALLMEQFRPPKGVHTLLVWADRDRSAIGERAAYRLKQQLADSGIQVYVFLPESNQAIGSKSYDWNDVLLQQGTGGVPVVEDLTGC